MTVLAVFSPDIFMQFVSNTFFPRMMLIPKMHRSDINISIGPDIFLNTKVQILAPVSEVKQVDQCINN